MRQTSIPFMIE